MENKILNTVIIGSGPAGYTAAIYCSRAMLNPVLITGADFGGQLATTPEIENWPGRSDSPDGASLMDSLFNHAKKLGTQFVYDTVVSCSLKGEIKTLTLSSGEQLQCKSVIICTGAKAKYLECKNEDLYKGHGVSACATCDGFFFRNKTVAVVGGGSAAFTEALYLSSLCKKVYLIHRRDSFRAEKALVDKLKALTDKNVQFILNAKVDEYTGDGGTLKGIILDVDTNKQKLSLDGVFVAVGHKASTEIFKNDLELENGIIKTGYSYATSTSCSGVFAAGDCADDTYRQAITSAGTGCMAALDAVSYLEKH
ncbi:thioredoxin-disulfide reductase [Succinivibrio faecicola]|uniref:Thioredoxin reductase n=1 Tax=Succinivibrio faecicola TaxID=2820300 RepID=A0ABS7DDW4_9GAMM|nr:thioredoxin-disulfide reductase [Succinivibrio faecicola]MBW7569487.1 thioredoxin-disulfide reductase [Succinivibrio faecicola]